MDYDPKTVKTNISNVTEDDLVIVKNKTVRITEPLTPVIEYAYYLGNKSPDWIPVWTDLPAIINEVFS